LSEMLARTERKTSISMLGAFLTVLLRFFGFVVTALRVDFIVLVLIRGLEVDHPGWCPTSSSIYSVPGSVSRSLKTSLG
jgi:hypothetical protein